MGSANDLSAFQQPQSVRKGWHQLVLIGLAFSCLITILPPSFFPFTFKTSSVKLTASQQATLRASIDRCSSLHTPAGPPAGFSRRSQSDRAIEGSAPILIKNVTLWTGKPEEGDDFGEVLKNVDVYVADGLIQSIDKTGKRPLLSHETTIEGNGAWMTPGIIDVSLACSK